MPKVTFEREDITVEVPAGENLLEVADRAGVEVFRGIWKDLHCGDSMTGWCNRCKVWVKPENASAVNPPTRKEKSRFRLNGRVSGTMRLACQVEVKGNVTVHTRSGGPGIVANTNWQADAAPTKWKERWEKRAADSADDGAEDAKSE